MKSPLRFVVAGAGAFGREHLRILAGIPGAEIAGIADRDASALAAAADRYGAGDRDTDALALIGRVRPDGLIVATPGATHVPLARHALGLGIPVLVEKPVALTAAEAGLLVEAERQSGAFVLPGHILRFSEPYRQLVEIARSPEIGRILSVTARRHRDDSHAVRYREDPVLMTMIHDIDLAIWITGAAAGDVVASRRPVGTSRSETLMTGTGAGGAVWRLSTAWTFPAASCPPDRIEVIGEAGSVELEFGNAIRSFGPAPRHIDISRVEADQPHRAELDYFAACIASGKKPAVVTLAEAIAGLETSDAILAALRNA